MTQLLAISVGIVDPVRSAELWVYLISIIIGAGLNAIFVASLTAVFAEMGASGKEYRANLDMLHQYMHNQKMDATLRGKIKSFFMLCYPERKMFHEEHILNQLSRPLQTQIALLKCDSVLRTLRVVDDPNLARTIAIYLERVVYIDDDYIIRAGDYGRGMYFISDGNVEIFIENKLATTLGQNAFFGEMALLDPSGRSTGDVRAKVFCEGYHLSRENFCEP